MNDFAFDMYNAILFTNTAYFTAVGLFRKDKPGAVKEDGLVHMKFFHPLPPVLDESRLFHRLLRCWINYNRHVDPSFIDPRLRPFVDVRSDDDGEFSCARRQDCAGQLGAGPFSCNFERIRSKHSPLVPPP